MKVKIGFIGAGRMAEAMIRGLIVQEVYSENEIIACAPSEKTRKRVAESLDIEVYATAAEVAERTDVIVIAVKPIQIPGLFEKEGLDLNGKLVISIAAGVKIDTINAYVPDARIVRVMPNHCCMVLEGASGYSRGRNVTDEDIWEVDMILSSIGLAIETEEKDLDAVTGVSGSSPAFMYMLAEAIAEIGEKNGLSADTALELTAQSLAGAGRMLLETGLSPKELINSVCSPGGTTIEGVKVLETEGFGDIVKKATEAVISKSRSMG